MAKGSEAIDGREREALRLEALARVAGAAAPTSRLDDVLVALAVGVHEAFGLEVVVNLLDRETDRFTVRAATDGPAALLGTWSHTDSWTTLLVPDHEIARDVFFIPHDAGVDQETLGAVHTPDHEWSGPGHWHPLDMCFVRMRTSSDRVVGILSVDSSVDQHIPDEATFELLRLFSAVGANAIENHLLSTEIASLEAERRMGELRKELEEEVDLRRSLLAIGERLGAASASGAGEIFPALGERLGTVVPITSLTVWSVDPARESIRAVYHSDPAFADAVMAYRFDFGVGATGQAVLRGESVISNYGDPIQINVHIPGEPDRVGEHVMAVPVVVEDQVKVALTLRRAAAEEPFTPDEARRAELFAQHAASAFLLQELADHRRQLAEKVDQLEEMNHHKDAFVAGVSHELRTPLTAIIGNVMTVAGLGDMLGADERRELLVAAERQAKSLGELLENLLAESRLSGNDPLLSPVSVDVTSFVDEVAETLRFRAPGRTVLAHVDGRPEVVTDRTLLYRVLFNLGDNALKYSDGPVTIAARDADDAGIRFEVEDRGIGINPEKIPLVFEQFSQVDPSDPRKVGGVGLGLHLVRKATEALGGTIHVDSRLGVGSTFSVWLPRMLPKQNESAA
ncbi:MAG TPA: GAF domain-containing sensor histidine kinase [Actinomycetota bacterium]|nr:GAF domain-containing sensor histidine kinase [Actinomycetota bacterium]